MNEQQTAPATWEQAQALLDDTGDLFISENITLDSPQAGNIRFRGRFQCDLSDCFDELKNRFEKNNSKFYYFSMSCHFGLRAAIIERSFLFDRLLFDFYEFW